MEEPEHVYAPDDPQGLDFTPVDRPRSFLHNALTWLVLLAALGLLAYGLWCSQSARR